MMFESTIAHEETDWCHASASFEVTSYLPRSKFCGCRNVADRASRIAVILGLTAADIELVEVDKSMHVRVFIAYSDFESGTCKSMPHSREFLEKGIRHFQAGNSHVACMARKKRNDTMQ
eukprot:972539-Amphidinium_carterae.1